MTLIFLISVYAALVFTGSGCNDSGKLTPVAGRVIWQDSEFRFIPHSPDTWDLDNNRFPAFHLAWEINGSPKHFMVTRVGVPAHFNVTVPAAPVLKTRVFLLSSEEDLMASQIEFFIEVHEGWFTRTIWSQIQQVPDSKIRQEGILLDIPLLQYTRDDVEITFGSRILQPVERLNYVVGWESPVLEGVKLKPEGFRDSQWTSAGDPDVSKPDIVVFVEDAVRPDHLPLYGKTRVSTPALERYFQSGTIFTNCYANSTWTRPSIASLFTGHPVYIHGCTQRGDRLNPAISVLTEILKQNGYLSGGVTANGNICEAFGFSRGFEEYPFVQEPGSGYARAGKVVEIAMEYLHFPVDQAKFLYFHTVDPHDPYLPPEQCADLYLDTDRSETRYDYHYFGKINRGEYTPTHAEIQEMKALYDAEITCHDQAMDRMIQELETRNDDTLFIYLSDHGEQFMEHGYTTHGLTLHGEEARVPLAIRRAGDTGPVRIVDTPVTISDLFNTVLDAAGVTLTSHRDGRSLLPLLDGKIQQSAERPLVQELYLGAQSIQAIRLGEWCLIRNLSKPSIHLFHTDDRAEQQDLAAEFPEQTARLHTLLNQWFHHRSDLRFPVNPVLSETIPDDAIDAELRSHLQALGYLK